MTPEYVRKVVAAQRDYEIGAAERLRASQRELEALAMNKRLEAESHEAKVEELEKWLNLTQPE